MCKVLHSTAHVSKTPLTGPQRHKSRRQKETRSLCKLTCAHHIRLSSTALLNTCRMRLRGFLQGLQTMARAVLLLLSVENNAKTLWDSSLTTKKGEIHGSSILENQANKQQCMKRKLLSSFSKNNPNSWETAY